MIQCHMGQIMKCWECELETDEIHHHHVIPRSRGGKKTVPLCLNCHGKAHHRKKSMASGSLIKEGLERKKTSSAVDGSWAGGHPPKGFTVDKGGYLVPNEDFPLVLKAVKLYLEGNSLRKIAQALGVSQHSVIQRWIQPWKDDSEKLFAYLADYDDSLGL